MEEVVRRIDAKLDKMDAAIDRLRSVIGGLRVEMGELRAAVAESRGIVRNLPSTWQMMTAIIAGQVALAAMLLSMARLFGLHL